MWGKRRLQRAVSGQPSTFPLLIILFICTDLSQPEHFVTGRVELLLSALILQLPRKRSQNKLRTGLCHHGRHRQPGAVGQNTRSERAQTASNCGSNPHLRAHGRSADTAPQSRAHRPQRGGAGAALKWRRRRSAPPGCAMKLIIQETYERASEWAAKYIRNRIVHFAPGPGRYFTLGLPTGGWRWDRAGCEGLSERGGLPEGRTD